MCLGIVITDNSYEFVECGELMVVAFGFATFVSLFTIILTHGTTKATIETDKIKYESLVYKVESGSYDNEDGSLRKDVLDEVEQWNEDVTSNKMLQRNFWIGIYIPNIYDDYKTIDYKK
jgi:hypothetical protein